MKRLSTTLTLALILATASLKGDPAVKNPTVVMKTSMGSITIGSTRPRRPRR